MIRMTPADGVYQVLAHGDALADGTRGVKISAGKSGLSAAEFAEAMVAVITGGR